MPDKLARWTRVEFLDVKESMCTRSTAMRSARSQGKVTDSPEKRFRVHRPCGSQVVPYARIRPSACSSHGVFETAISMRICVFTVCTFVSSALWDCARASLLSYCRKVWSLVRAFLNDKVYLSVLWYVQRKLALTASGGSERKPQQVPPTTQNVNSSPAGSPSHPHEKNRHLKLCDMCQRRCHWATAADVAGIDSTRAARAGWGTYRVWWVSVPILVKASSQAASQI